jgi:hypothetical protein
MRETRRNRESDRVSYEKKTKEGRAASIGPVGWPDNRPGKRRWWWLASRSWSTDGARVRGFDGGEGGGGGGGGD